MINNIRIFLLLVICIINLAVNGQRRGRDDAPVTFEELYDDPYDINKLFVKFQPIYGEIFVANVNAGFGVELNYYLKDKLDFHASFRTTYAKIFDMSRNLGEKNSIFTKQRNGISNTLRSYVTYEFGATYHFKDFTEESETTMYLYKKSYRGDKWAARVPKQADIPSSVRKIYGARLGALAYNSSTDFSRAIGKQEVKMTDIKSSDGTTLLAAVGNTKTDELSLFGNVDVAGFYVGASMAWIRNVAVQFDSKYQPGVDDLILTAYADFIYAPFITVENIQYSSRDKTGNITTRNFDTSPINTSTIGFRLGIDGKFNRTLSWGYGAEIGSKPTLQSRGLYALIKISFPIYSTKLNYKVEAFGK